MSQLFSYLSARAAEGGAACTTPVHLHEYDHKPLVGHLSFHVFNIWLSGACTLVASVLATTLLMEHATHLSNPSQQIKIMRIIHMLPAYAGLSFLSICWPETYVYLTAWIEYFQALALYAFLLLLIDFLAPTDQDKLAYFGSLKVPKIFRRGKYREGVSFLKLTLYGVMQYPFFITITGITQCITQALNVYCLNSDSPSYAHLWLKILTNAPLAIAMATILRFYNICSKDMKELHPLRKLLAFKLVVGVIFAESVVFTILSSHGVLHETGHLTFADIYIGMPNMLICVQMVPLALLMRWAYPAKEYKLDGPFNPKFANVSGETGYSRVLNRDRSYQGGRFGYRAWLSYLNPLKIWKDGMAMRKLLREVRLKGQNFDSWPADESSEELKTKNDSPRSQSPQSEALLRN